ncbi:MAG TPA: Fe-Mn family superoxide dismutase [Miltoncostaeaceae bacterium]|nr:Fe-Mn family superoxide dismutase [Miltoncostaeaceae bacterium]
MHHAEPHQVSAMPKPDKILKLDGISPESVEAHWGLYEAYVKKYNEVMEKLPGADRGAANQIYSDYRGLREMLTFAIGGIKNHEVYFLNLSADGGSPSDALAGQVEKDFGGHDDMITELKAGGMAARGWAWVAWDWDWQRLDVYIGDAQNTFPVWNATPILALDVYEHSYIRDFSTARPKYIDAFVANIDWADVSARFERIASVAQ